jgi:hypothetical protein
VRTPNCGAQENVFIQSRKISTAEVTKNESFCGSGLATWQTEREVGSSAIRVIFAPDFTTMSLDDTL